MANRTRLAALGLGALLAAPPATAQVTVSIQRTAFEVETVFVADFAPYNVGQQPDFLAITIVNGLSRAQTIKLYLRVRQVRPDNVLLFEGNTDPFALNIGVRRITNRDLANEGSDVVIEDFEIGANIDELTDKIAQTGRFPSGTYLFEAEVKTPTGLSLGTSQLSIELVNPSRLELLAPGRAFGDQPEVVTTPAPRFQWSADEGLVSGLGEYKIRVVPVAAAASPEEAMQGFASWEATTSATTAIYPGSVTAIPLAAGETYAWQVTREVKTSGGTNSLASPIYWFKMVGGADQQGSRSGGGGSVGANVELIEFGRGLGLENELNGFHPTGQIIVDGRPVSGDNLEALLRAILSGDLAIHTATVR